MWFNFHVFGDFCIILLISNLTPLWSENIFCMITILLNVSGFMPDDGSMLVYVPWALENNAYLRLLLVVCPLNSVDLMFSPIYLQFSL